MESRSRGSLRRTRSAAKRMFDGVLRAASVYGAAVKLAQLAPLAFGLVLVALTPDAWLSGTLRRWALGGMLLGSAAGCVGLYLLSSQGQLKRAAATAFAVLVAAALLLRWHLAVVSVPFIEAYPAFQPLFDFYLGTGEWQVRLYNALAATLFALAAAAATLALPAWLASRRSRAGAADEDKRRAAELAAAARTLATGLEWLQRRADDLEEDNRRLRAEVQALRGALRRASAVRAAVAPPEDPAPAPVEPDSRKA